MKSVSVSEELGFMCVKWNPVFNSNHFFHVKINHIFWHSALFRNVRQICADKNDFSTSTNGLIIIIGIQPLGRFGQKPELSQATDNWTRKEKMILLYKRIASVMILSRFAP